jgi:hypothetical protein
MKKKFEGRQSEAKAPDSVLPRFSASKTYAAGADFQIKKRLKPNTVSLRLIPLFKIPSCALIAPPEIQNSIYCETAL